MSEKTDTTDQQTIFPLNNAQNEGIMHEAKKLAATALTVVSHKRSTHGNDSQAKVTQKDA